ncbi:MAG: hypothetical protein RRY39_02895 [Odoribacter sp.]
MMKKIIAFAFGVCLMGGVAEAQTLESKYGLDSAKTIENASIYNEFVKQKNYKDALPAWRYVFNNAPMFQMMTYTKGEDIMVGMFQQTKNPAYIDTLMMVYDQWIKYFGNHSRLGEGYILGKKGASLYRFGRSEGQTQKEAYGYLRKSFDLEGTKTHPVTVQIMFYAAGDLLKKNLLTKDEYVALYMKLSEYAENGIKQASKPEMFKEVKDKLDAMFFDAGVADCATLNTLLSVKYQAKKEDVANLKEIASLLRRSECIDLPLYASVAEQLYKLDPSADAAYSLSILFLRRQDFDKTETYLKEAIAKAEDNTAKADYSLRMAQLKLSKGQLQAAKASALDVLKVTPNNGPALMLIGKAYAAYSKNYGEEDFDHASVFWVAVDKFQRAKQVDQSVAEEADKLILLYSQHFPNKEEAFFRNVTSGSNVRIGDWINETTTARFRQ